MVAATELRAFYEPTRVIQQKNPRAKYEYSAATKSKTSLMLQTPLASLRKDKLARGCFGRSLKLKVLIILFTEQRVQDQLQALRQ